MYIAFPSSCRYCCDLAWLSVSRIVILC